MGWGMWVLMLLGMAAFWAAVLMGVRALFLAGGSTPERGSRDVPHPAAPRGGGDSNTDRHLPAGEDANTRSVTAPIERQR